MAPHGHALAATEVVKPCTDQQEYKYVVLENQLQALLISDAEADKAGAAMDVRVGSLSDPPDFSGLAHFLEHMLFYSSEKYPEEDEYSKFIARHPLSPAGKGGHTNAYTSAESTNYQFDCNWDALEPALDRFAQFFIAPLISGDGVEREVRAVDSEHARNLNSDAWRKWQLWRQSLRASHPMSRFHTGNYATLLAEPKAKGLSPLDAVRDFHARFYSANLMRLAVVGRQPLAELEALVRRTLASVPNQALPPPAFDADILEAGAEQVLLRMVPEKQGHRLELQWAVPPEHKNYRVGPCGFLGHLLGHEGAGSVFAALKCRGWATSLSAGEGGTGFSARSFFAINLELTDKGHQRVREIGDLIFTYIELLQGPGGVTRERFEEMRHLSHTQFDYSEKLGAFQLASSLASQLQITPPEDVLLAMHHVPLDYSEAKIREVLDLLTPDAVRILWASKEFEGQARAVEPWYGTRYGCGDVPCEWLASWRAPGACPELHLPAPNPFIPSDFRMIEAAAPVPRVIASNPRLRLWHKPEVAFRAPKACAYLALDLPAAYTSPEAAVLTRLLTLLVDDALNEVAYEAELAGLRYSLQAATTGLVLSFAGYSHKLLVLARRVLGALANFQVDAARFEVQREHLAKEYENYRFDQPYQHALYSACVLLEAQRWHTDDYARVITGLTPAALTAFYKRLMERCFAEAYITGNCETATAVEFGNEVVDVLLKRLGVQPLMGGQRPQRRGVRLPTGAALLAQPALHPANANSAAFVAYQVGKDATRQNALAELLVQCAKRDAFYRLRTVEQLGYMTFLTGYTVLTVRHVAFIIQSAAFTAAHLRARIEAFSAAWAAQLADMSEEDFAGQAEELAKAKRERPKRLRQLAAREWAEIDSGALRFDRQAIEAAAIEQLSKSELQAFFQEAMLGPAARKLTVCMCAEPSPLEAAEARAAVQQNAAEAMAGRLPAAAALADGAPGGALGLEPPPCPVQPTPSAAENGHRGGGPDNAGLQSTLGVALEGSANGLANGSSDSVPGLPSEVIIDNIWAFKRKCELFPSLK